MIGSYTMKRAYFLWCAMFIALWLMVLPVQAQYNLKTWKTSDYPFTLSSMLDITQDEDGYIWIGTDGNGLLRFDGVKFTQYSKENTAAFHNDTIGKLFFDSEGVLWIALKGGGIVKYEDETFSRPLNEFSEVNQFMVTVTETDDGSMWFGSDGGGLYRLKEDSLQNFKTSNSGIPSNHVFSLAEYKGKLLVGFIDRIAEATYDPEMSFRSMESIPHITLSINIIDGFAWLGTGNGLYKYNGTSLQNYKTGGNKFSNHITDFIKDASGNWWATSYNGLFKFDPHEGSLKRKLFYDSPHPYFTIFEDADQNIWLPPVGVGLTRIRPTIFTSFPRSSEVPGTGYSVQQLGNKDFAISSTEGLFRYRNGSVSHLVKDMSTIGPLLVDSKKRLWIGSNSGGVSRYENGSIRTVALPDLSINALYESSDQSIWIGALGNGLYRWQENNGSEAKLQSFKLSNSAINAISEDSSGAIWVGTDYGLNKITDDSTYVFGDEDKKELPDPVITSLHVDNQNNLWVGTRQGGLLLHQEGDFFVFNSDYGISASYIDQIQVDNRGVVWFGTKKGLYSVPRSKLLAVAEGKVNSISPKIFSTIDGLPSLTAISNSYPGSIQTANNDLLFVFEQDIIRIDPSKEFTRPKPTAPVVETVSFDYEAVPSDQANTVPPSVSSVEIDYTVPEFGTPEQIEFQYKMEPFDKNWVDAEQRRSAFYTNLPSGDYNFKIVATNSIGKQSTVTSFPISVVPPWYRTTYAYIGYGMLVIFGIPGLVFGYNYWNTRRLEAQNEELRSMVQERTEQIRAQKNQIEEQVNELEKQQQQRSRFLANISHEFRTPLTLIITPLEDMLESKPADNPSHSRKQIKGILHNARRINQLTSQLLDLSRLEVGRMPRDPVPIELVQFVDSFTNEFVPLANRDDINLVFKTETEHAICEIDQDILIKILGNLLSNAFKFTSPGNSILVRISTGNGQAVITVQDTGIGIDKEKIEHIFDRFYQVDLADNGTYGGAGIGLALVKELINSSGGHLEVESASQKGTTFNIFLPLSDPKSDLVVQPDFQKLNTSDGEIRVTERSTGTLTEGESLAEQDKPLLLIVDDHPDIREIIQMQFADTFRTLEAENGDQALTYALDKLPDLIICDIMMPETDGITFLKKLRDHQAIAHIPVIMLTAKTEEKNRLNSLQIGADAYITKPFSRKELDIRVQKLIEKQRKLRKYFRKKVLSEADDNDDALSDDEQFIVRLKEIVEANLANPDFTNKQFAKEAGCSRSKLNRQLKKTLDTTPNQFVRSYRLKKSKQLLQKGSGTISEVAYSVGFNSLSYFSKCFKKEFGHAPSEV